MQYLTMVQKFHFRTRRQELNSVEGGESQNSKFAFKRSGVLTGSFADE